jgi:Phosphotransferase enzyme family
MRVAVDFDNTIVCYDDVFHRAAVEKGWLTAGDRILAKGAVRDTLRAQGMEEEWIHLQGYVYGAGMHLARPYPGVKDFFDKMRAAGIEAAIVSHRTKTPFRGPQTDLHAAAQSWLAREGFLDPARTGLDETNVYFELTKEQKLARIAALQPHYFIDDLIEFLSEPAWPASVNRILFDPAGHHAGGASFATAATWSDIGKTIFAMAGDTALDAPPGLSALLHDIGAAPALKVVRLQGGTNNLVYRVETLDGTFCCKAYGADPPGRDRFACETAFVRFAAANAIRAIPELLAADAETRCALFNFVEGQKVDQSAIDAHLVEQALAFCIALDSARNDPAARALPNASDCCLSLDEHLQSVDRRLARLSAAENRAVRDLVGMVREQTFPALERRLREFSVRSGEAMDRLLTASERAISASDFGFHNALVDAARRLTFLDFEYAGWDDPAKMIADFFAQADLPVPLQFLDPFLARFAGVTADGAMIAARCRAILPLHRVKWALILLNGFLRDRPDATPVDEAELTVRLARAQTILAQIEPWFVAEFVR